MLLQDRLAGTRLVMTGVTGFVGEALLHKILTDVPGMTVTVLVRPKGSMPGTDRIAALLRKPIFADCVSAAGGVETLMRERVAVLEGDLSAVPDLPAGTDAVVHCAGDVSFDPPIDEAFASNMAGTERLLAKVAQLPGNVHYVHVSTAYVAGRRRGAIPEAAVPHSVDRHAEARHAAALRDRVEERSRSPQVLAGMRRSAERAHLRAGFIAAAEDTEQRRTAWVHEQLVSAGAERARSLGWTDVYTFTKAMGERVVEEYAASTPTLRCTIVRPSIIESALESPYPGWIEGFKMAEPLILAFGRGELPEFPAAPDSVVDIVPVDHVVNALVAVLATTPESTVPAYFHVSSGLRNPMTFHGLYERVLTYFDAHPFDSTGRGAARLPAWRFPGGEAVERLLSTSERAHKAADWAVTHAPRSDRTRDVAMRLDRRRRSLEFLRRYIDLYREYAQAELRFVDDATVALHASLDAPDRARFSFDTAVVDWDRYIVDVHCPAVTAPIRRLDAIRRKRAGSRPTGLARVEASPQEPVLAAFDMDGTLLSSNVVETYLWMRLPDLDPSDRFGELASVIGKLPRYVEAERRDRGAFLRAIYRRYAGADLDDLNAFADEILTDHVLDRLSPQAVRRVREHRAAGHHTVLVTGAIRPLTRPLAPLFDTIVAADLAVDANGRCTGHLTSPPMVGEARSAWLRRFAEVEGFDLSASFAYADSHSDLPLLEAVGHPTAITPDVPLQRAAKQRHWPIATWTTSPTASRASVPAGRIR
ncbi:MAG: HAD-IB family hydrolase [Nocardioidaceae bacterium]